MRREDIAKERRPYLVRAEGHPNVWALVAPPTPHALPPQLRHAATHGDKGLPPDVRVTERHVLALQHGLERVRKGGRAALDLTLLHELHALLMEEDAGRFSVGAYRQEDVNAVTAPGRFMTPSCTRPRACTPGAGPAGPVQASWTI